MLRCGKKIRCGWRDGGMGFGRSSRCVARPPGRTARLGRARLRGCRAPGPKRDRGHPYLSWMAGMRRSEKDCDSRDPARHHGCGTEPRTGSRRGGASVRSRHRGSVARSLHLQDQRSRMVFDRGAIGLLSGRAFRAAETSDGPGYPRAHAAGRALGGGTGPAGPFRPRGRGGYSKTAPAASRLSDPSIVTPPRSSAAITRSIERVCAIRASMAAWTRALPSGLPAAICWS